VLDLARVKRLSIRAVGKSRSASDELAGAGWLVPLCGEIMTMPGLGRTAAAFDVDIDEHGRTVGLF